MAYVGFLLLVLAALIFCLIKLRQKDKVGKKTVSFVQRATTTVEPVVVDVTQHDKLVELARNADDERFYMNLQMAVNAYLRSGMMGANPMSAKNVQVLVNVRSVYLFEKYQEASQDAAGAEMRLANRLDEMQKFCEETCGALLQSSRLLEFWQIKKLRSATKVFTDYTTKLQLSGGAKLAHVFYPIECGDKKLDKMAYATFDKVYDEIDGDTEKRALFERIKPGFTKEFHEFREPVAEAQKLLTEARKNQVEARNRWAMLSEYCKTHGEIGFVLNVASTEDNANNDSN